MGPDPPLLTSDQGPLNRLKLARIRDIDVLESGAYWPQLQPYFRKPDFRRLRYEIANRNPRPETFGEVLATRGASGLNGLDVAHIADRFATVLTITEAGLPDYCITAVRRGALELRAAASVGPIDVGEATGTIYRGRAGTQLRAADDHERLAIWIRASCLNATLTALLGEPGKDELEFAPAFEWSSGPGQAIKRLVWLLTEELANPHSFALNSIARQSFTDLLLYSLLEALPHSYTDRLARARTASPVPRTVRRAENFIHAHAGQPVALHEVAQAAGCSVRALQLSFRRFRDTTPVAAMRQARLEAAKQALVRGGTEATVGEIARRYGFTNPGRFASLYRESFGTFPAEALPRRTAPLRPRPTSRISNARATEG